VTRVFVLKLKLVALVWTGRAKWSFEILPLNTSRDPVLWLSNGSIICSSLFIIMVKGDDEVPFLLQAVLLS